MHDLFQQISMSVMKATTVRMVASTDLAPTSVRVLEGTCCIQMDGVVYVSRFCAPLMMFMHLKL